MPRKSGRRGAQWNHRSSAARLILVNHNLVARMKTATYNFNDVAVIEPADHIDYTQLSILEYPHVRVAIRLGVGCVRLSMLAGSFR